MSTKPGICPFAVWHPSPNFGYPTRGTPGRQGALLRAGVFHIAQGSLPATISWFSDPASQVSTHFAVGKMGEIFQFVSLNDAAWGNGVIEPGNSVPPWHDPTTNLNNETWSVEAEGYSGQSLTHAQLAGLVRLTVWVHQWAGLGYSVNTMLRHSEIAPVSRGSCPGPAYPLEHMIDLLARASG